MAEQYLTIKQGDASTFTETISGVSSTSGYLGKMYIFNSEGTVQATITGVVGTLEVVYDITNEVTKALTPGTYEFETKLFDSNDHVYSQSNGIFEIRSTNEEDPL